ncbi:hypothetical protein [Streptomyces sp. DASNCL29]|uniref:hypothetical protein n=1 Tax=Streptomyces sp. DASNCL29 TaxID=2583819 RepID=UPI001F0D65D3|nr:hypothetical protein [Streptomyces sp. DASNCL29]
MSERIVFDVDRDGWTKGLQLNIAQLDENGSGTGYRLHGPKYNGSSKNLIRHVVDERDAAEIRQMLDAVFPPVAVPSRAEVLAEAKREVVAWLLKKAGEYRATGKRQREADAVSVMASKIDRGAVRLFLDEAGKVTRDAGEITQPAEKGEPADTCDRCRQPFDPSDARFDGRARHLYSPFCRRCVDRCHESTDAFHVCAVCRTADQPPSALRDAEIQFAVYGTITLSDWRYLELAPDYYGHTYMQIGGWLPEGWDPEQTPAGTQQMLRARLHGYAVPHDLPVQVSTTGYGGPRRFMKIQWRKGGESRG